MKPDDHRRKHLMPSIWKGRVRDGKVVHRVQLMGNDNTPMTFCQKQPVTIMSHSLDRFAGPMCLRCDWSDVE